MPPSYLSTDAFELAEQGFSIMSSNIPTTTQPLKVRNNLSSRHPLHNPGNSQGGASNQNQVDDHKKSFPRQRIPKTLLISRLSASCYGALCSFLTLLIRSPKNIAQDRSADYQDGYAKFNYEGYEDSPVGWPMVASYMDGCDSFNIFRRYGRIHARLLITRMSNIEDLIKKLDKMDQDDQNSVDEPNSTHKRLRNRKAGLETAKHKLLHNIEMQILAYGKLLRNHHRLKSMPQTPAKDHDSVFKWLFKRKPLDDGEFDWIYYPNDYVSMVPPRRNPFENFIKNRLDAQPNSILKRFCAASESPKDTSVQFLSTARVITMARIIVVFFVISILFIPVIIFMLTSMSHTWMTMIVLIFFILFAGMISLLTEADVPEIFIGTATYGAVLVTFLGNLKSAP